MKKNLLLLALLALASVGFTACSGDDENEGKGGKTNTPEQTEKKDALILNFSQDDPVDYSITNEDGVKDFTVAEIELTEAGYYIAKLEKKRDMEVKATRADASPEYFYLWGWYTQREDGTYDLAGFGYLSIQMLPNGSARVSVTVISSTNGGSFNVTVSVTTPPANVSTPTEKLCRGWDIISTRVQIEGVSGFYQEKGCNLNSILEYIRSYSDVKDNLKDNQIVDKIVFTKNRTFQLLYENEEIDRATWKWTNEQKGELQYTWDFGDMGYSFIDKYAQVTFATSETPTQLKLFGTVNDGTGAKKVTATINLK